MKIKLLSEIFVSGEPKAVGDVVEVSDGDGQLLISSNRAEAYTETEKTEPIPEPAEIKTENKKKGKK